MEIAIEVKAARKITAQHLKGLRSLKKDHPEVKRRFVICCEYKYRVSNDNIEIIPAEKFTEMLWQGNFF